MRKLVFLLFGLTFIFTINLLVYVLNEDYRFLVKKVKYNDDVVYDTGLNVSDEQDLLVQAENKVDTNTLGSGSLSPNLVGKIRVNSKQSTPIALNSYSEDILARFDGFLLERVTQHSSLFGISSEYPDEYFEYVGRDVTLYFFPTKNYYDTRDIFDTLSFELPFRINQVNNFGEKSFYINLKTGLDDGYVRVVVSWEESVFGLKIKKDVYNDVRIILENLDITPIDKNINSTRSEKNTETKN